MTAAAIASPASSDPITRGRAALAEGDPGTAAALFHSVSVANLLDYESRYWLYSALVAAGERGAANPVLEEARNLHAMAVIQAVGGDMDRFRNEPAYCAEIGLQLYAAKLMGAASLALGRSLDFQSLNSQHMLSYGLSLQHQGRMAEAIDVFTAMTELFARADIHSFLLYPLFHGEDRLQRLSDEARRWASLYAAPNTPARPVFFNERKAGRRMRIGYVGPSFTRNQVAQFLLPVLEAHDPAQVEVFLYCADPGGEAPLPASCAVRKIGGLGDKACADLIRGDKIDILIDVWGHTAGSRLPVFGYRPAPIQCAWINFVQTTGLDCMDYVFHADSMAGPEDAKYFTEKVLHIGPIVTPYRIAEDRPAPVPTPALKNGYITYGSFNNPSKLSEMTVAAWSLILRDRPTNRLVLKYSYFLDPVLQRVTQARFAAYGANPDQIEFRGHTAGQDYWREFQDIDLALDPSPCPGGTTSCDALANGVPVLTHVGDDFYSRIGVPVMGPCGLEELIAEDWDDYVARAIALTSDVEALDRLRSKVSAGFDASPYRDEIGFTRNLESKFREIHDAWVAGGRG